MIRTPRLPLIGFTALLCAGCSIGDRQQDQINDAAAEAVESSERIAELERKVELLENRDDAIVNYVKAVRKYTTAVEQDSRKADDKIIKYVTAVDAATSRPQ